MQGPSSWDLFHHPTPEYTLVQTLANIPLMLQVHTQYHITTDYLSIPGSLRVNIDKSIANTLFLSSNCKDYITEIVARKLYS